MAVFFARFLALASFIFFQSVAYSQSIQWDPKVVEGELDNGFRYAFYSSSNPQEPFNLRLIVNAGSVDDEMRGMAHIVEHMVFRANRAHDKDMHRLFDQLGWKTGTQVNALTRQTETQYMVRTRPNDALDLTQSIQLVNDLAFGAKMLEADWNIEREVILEEMRRGDGVAKRVNTAKKVVVRNGSRYIDRPTIGWKQDIRATTVEQIRDFYSTYYVPGNMTLVASGYIERDSFIDAVEQTFGKEKTSPVPERDYVKLPLKAGLVIGKVQDPMGTTSAVTYGFRSPMLPKGNFEGEYQQLQNYFLRKLVKSQVRASKALYTADASSVHITLSEPTNERLIVALSAKVSDHPKGLEIVLREIERLKQTGISDSELAALKAKAVESVQRNREVIPHRDFAKWEDKITAAVVQGAIEEDYSIKSQRTLKWIDEMTAESLNQRLVEILSAPDQFLFYQIPGGVEQALPTQQQVAQVQQQVSQEKLARLAPVKATFGSKKPQKETIVLKPSDKSLASARVLSKHRHLGDDVTEWRLANGDRVVWLDRETDGNALYLKALSTAGYYNHQQQPWLSQTAYQIWQQADYGTFNNQQFNQWQQQEKMQWQWAQTGSSLDLSARIAPEKLRNLMNNYLVMQQEWQLQADALSDVKQSLHSLVETPDEQALARRALLGQPTHAVPTVEQIEQLTLEELTQTIRELQQQPVSLFIVGKTSAKQIENNVLPFMASNPRQLGLQTYKPRLPEGAHTLAQPMYDDHKSTVTIKGESSMTWSPESSFLVSTLNPMIQKALKNKLRHELGGVYSLRFEMTLDKDNTVRTNMSFTTAPEKVDMLVAAYQDVMSQLSSHLLEENYPRTQEDIRFAEQLRLQDTNTWLRRLSLSYEKYQAPDYLRSMKTLDQRVTADELDGFIQHIFPLSKQAVLIGQPKAAADQPTQEL
ncbi:M16 family metallopeptidase [Vibrio hippocampi]|uniref:Peptidase M16 n=1 Tax=Vibrio hippocampi TaxID=654686 RepID=A0ABN8DJC4_9VIBR|nr:insulinase family protein [Vibrio hippocampi]CAH0528911.1 hypothetical protein VHP8226_02941 [Vibrio hippocampi]